MNVQLYLFLIIPTFILAFWAQQRVVSTYRKYSQIRSRSGITGAEAASYVMRQAGINDVEIVPIQGELTDHYDPTRKRLCLSQHNFGGTSLAALGVAAHEAGHAIQHKVGYSMLQTRMALGPITNIASRMLPLVVFGGLFFHFSGFILLGVVVYAILTVFQLITLPVEFDASRRATVQLDSLGIIESDELPGVKKTLNAAGWTYIAAFVSSLSWLLYFLAASRR
ncbi:zinc metallopeptidase [Puniceicoccus vermicola]|uniref:Zinc metallopeptidase n=1 Tax=Puniceicoccus vermicola TaxID=388746 RepID=A0A7X1AXT4_9BACT|nr:zinc metallopeptidase [Puniceicoccus vermicola]MBC2601932.1 zinc metallopeptidase [Puniceicoccus vermicola]